MRQAICLRALIAALIAAACSAPHTSRFDVTGQTHVYRCPDGFRFVVRYEPQRAWLFLGDQLASAPQVPTRAGLLYTNGEITLRSEGAGARLQIGTTDHSSCVTQPSESFDALRAPDAGPKR
jgi:membrane-bound inhibitor of C-type lysozyme